VSELRTEKGQLEAERGAFKQQLDDVHRHHDALKLELDGKASDLTSVQHALAEAQATVTTVRNRLREAEAASAKASADSNAAQNELERVRREARAAEEAGKRALAAAAEDRDSAVARIKALEAKVGATNRRMGAGGGGMEHVAVLCAPSHPQALPCGR
jgi:chromosome segregation ATPase